MDFDKIADTQEFEGNTVDVIFGKKRGRKRKSTTGRETFSKQDFGINSTPVDSSQDLSKSSLTQTQHTDSQEPFLFTNANIFRCRETSSSLFAKYFPPHLLQFTDEELAEINELYASLQEQQQLHNAADHGRLTEANVNEMDKSCLIERFLKENEANREAQQDSNQSSSSPFLLNPSTDSPMSSV